MHTGWVYLSCTIGGEVHNACKVEQENKRPTLTLSYTAVRKQRGGKLPQPALKGMAAERGHLQMWSSIFMGRCRRMLAGMV